MEIKYSDLVDEVGKNVILNNIGDMIVNGLRNIEIKELFLKWGDIVDLVYLFSSVIKGEYSVDLKTIANTIFGIVYVCIPVDFIPDFLGPIGYLDDIAVVKLVTNWIKTELKSYRKTQAYKNNLEHGFDLGYMFPLDMFTNFFKAPDFNVVATNFETFFPSEGSLEVNETALVQFNAKKEYNKKGYQNETIEFFPASIDEVVYVFNHLLSQSEGACKIHEDDILNRIILPSNKTRELVKKVLDNADKYYDKKLFTNFEKFVTIWLNNIEYSFTYEIIDLKEDYFEMQKPKIDYYEDSNINVYNAVYNAKPIYVNWESIYEVINLITEARTQNKISVNYLITLLDSSSLYTINYNSFSQKVKVSTCNTKDLFFEKDLEELIQSKL